MLPQHSASRSLSSKNILTLDADRKPLDPPPVIQLFVRDPLDPAQ